MLFLEGTPDTVAYMLAGYAVLLGFPIVYALTWVFRRAALKRDVEILATMQAEKEAAARRTVPNGAGASAARKADKPQA